MKQKPIIRRVEDFIESGELPVENREIAVALGITSQQVSTCLHSLKVEGAIERTYDGKWRSKRAPRPPKPDQNGGNLTMGDLLEIIGTTADGSVAVRLLEAPNTLYKITEV